MHILTASQLRAADTLTCQTQNLTPLALMERAARAAAEALTAGLAAAPRAISHVVVCCGPGNNGGDGLGVARLLAQMLPAPAPALAVWLLPNGQPSAEWTANRAQLPATVAVYELTADFPPLAADTLVVDALFGTGLSRPLDGIAAALVRYLNHCPVPIISLDVPSGLLTDAPTPAAADVVQATETFAFQTPKLPFLLAATAGFAGQWRVLDIGLDLSQTTAALHLTHAADVAALTAPRQKFGHKGTYGHALLLAGSRGKLGAAVLAARGCLRSGVGLLTVQVPAVGYGVLQASVPEAMTLTDAMTDYLSALAADTEFGRYQALGFGPGIGQHPDTALLLRELLADARRLDIPTVLDADALNLLAQYPQWMQHLPPRTVLTPHPKEFARLVGPAPDDYARLDLLRQLAADTGACILLKGAHSAIATPAGEVYFNATGNPGMATGGTGDVLTGVILGLLAQGLSPLDAARLGAFAHGHAGDLAAQTHGERGLTAGDVAERIGQGLRPLA